MRHTGYLVSMGANSAGDVRCVTIPRGRMAEAVRMLLRRYVRVEVWPVYEDGAHKSITQHRWTFGQSPAHRRNKH